MARARKTPIAARARTAPAATPKRADAQLPPKPQPAQQPLPLPPPVDVYRPVASYAWRGGRIRFPILFGASSEGVSDIPVDRYGNAFQPGAALLPLLRIGMRLETLKPLADRIMLMCEYEHDLPTGSWNSGTPVDGAGMPNSAPFGQSLRKGWGRLSIGRHLHVGGGFMTSHWGLGLLSNDGAHGWEPGSARFTDPRGGDIVLRGFLGTGPHTAASIVATVAFDKVWDEVSMVTGDSAYQLIASALIGHDRPTQGGFFFVHRRLTAADGSTLNVSVIDLAGRAEVKLKQATLAFEAEAALVAGETTIGASPEHRRVRVLQLGAVVRTSLAWSRVGGVLDLVYASGDQNSYDAGTNGFRADPNFETGLLLFRYVQAAQTGRGYATATDPMLVGAPPGGIERLPTRGGLTNAVVFFPRLWVRPVRGLEVYGGVLIALAPVKNIDPFNTKVAGGSPRNALDGNPGSYWGTELDLGLRYRVLLRGTELSAGLEGGVLLPGSALRDAAGNNPAPAYGGRILLTYRM